MNIDEKVSLLRAEMKQQGIDAYIIPTSDPHQSEYVADHWKTRIWISGFTGSAGTVVVTHDHAGLWTDSRYFIQADKELSDCSFELHKVPSPSSPNHSDWLLESMSCESVIAFDGYLSSEGQTKSLKRKLNKKGIIVKDNIDLIPNIWKNRPQLPTGEIFEHELVYAGMTRIEKLDFIRVRMEKVDSNTHFVSTLDDIAWILNIRSNDVEFNPVTIAYLIINMEDAYLYIDDNKVSEQLQLFLKEDQIFIKPYEAIKTDLSIAKKILIDPNICSTMLYQAINPDEIIEGKTPSRLLKAIKNDVEIAHIKNAMAKDGAALTKFFIWLEQNIENGFSEFELGEKLAFFRAQQLGYFGESFNPIVGFKGNGAIVHYSAPENGSSIVTKEGMLLIDSGGQYFDGTTDITRTVHLGTPTKEEKRNFTLVLKGHIALNEIVFPIGTKGANLDVLARQFLWKERLNYLHGTGHGVGFFLNVHEPPQGFAEGITSRSRESILPGMLTSNEPGYYKKDNYGIRIENLFVAEKDEVDGFLKHKVMTVFPIQKSLIEETLLTNAELIWINKYHQKVYDEISPLLNEEEKSWLKHKCRI